MDREEKIEKRKKQKKRRSTIGTIALFLAVFIIATAIMIPLHDGKTTIIDFFTGNTTIFDANARLSEEMTPIVIDKNSPFYEAFTSQDRVNVLLLGINDMMTDTIMVCSYDMEHQAVDLISVPRDTFYDRGYTEGSYSFNKINSIYRGKKGGDVVGIAEAVSNILQGMPIHYYAVVGFDDVEKIMKAIGGVQIKIPFHMKYEDTTKGKELYIDIPAGEQTIDETNVVGFLRFRHTNPWYAAKGYKSYTTADNQRIKVQQNFIKEVVKKCLQLGNIPDVAKVVLNNIESDLTVSMALRIASKALNINTERINAYSLPGTDPYYYNISFWDADWEKDTSGKIAAMLNEIFNREYPEDAEPAEGEEGTEGEGSEDSSKN